MVKVHLRCVQQWQWAVLFILRHFSQMIWTELEGQEIHTLNCHYQNVPGDIDSKKHM